MGNSSECTFLSNTDDQLQFLGEENHFLFGDIKYFKTEKNSRQHFAIKTVRFHSEKSLQKFKEFISIYEQICESLYLTRVAEYKNPKQKSTNNQNEKSSVQMNKDPFFQCNKDNLIFKSATQQISCSQPSYYITLNLQYLEKKLSLQSQLLEKSEKLRKALEKNKVNQNILLHLENKVKLFEYQKIDLLPPKQRAVVNLFFKEIEVLRILDQILTGLYGLRINGIEVNAVRPELFFKSQYKDEVCFFCAQAVNMENLSNFHKSYESLKKWLTEQNALFHHNWNTKYRQMISYVHPDFLQKLSECLISETRQNFMSFSDPLSKEQLQKQNIFALGLIILEICLIEPDICSKVYNVSTCKPQQKIIGLSKKQVKYSFQKQNLTLKLNNSALQKYLIQMKTRYSEQFVELVQFMLFGDNSHTSQTQAQTYQTIISMLSQLTQQNMSSLKSVYNQPNMRKAQIPKQQTETRKSSLSRQISYSMVSNNSLSSTSSLSMFPIKSRQKMLSVQLMKKNVKKMEKKENKIINKSQFEMSNDSFAKKDDQLEDLVKKDEDRILAQFKKLNNNKNAPQKQKRSSITRAEQNQPYTMQTGNCKRKSFGNVKNFQNKSNNFYVSYKAGFPKSSSFKSQSQSVDRQKKINRTTKTKKTFIQKAKQEQNMGNSVCLTINMNNSRSSQEKNRSNSNKKSVLGKIDSKKYKISQLNEIQPFNQVVDYIFNSKSQLKSLISAKKNSSYKIKQAKVQKQIDKQKSGNKRDKSPKEMKQKQLYQIYLNEYKNLTQSKLLTKQ